MITRKNNMRDRFIIIKVKDRNVVQVFGLFCDLKLFVNLTSGFSAVRKSAADETPGTNFSFNYFSDRILCSGREPGNKLFPLFAVIYVS
jgi:hypothetical protein